jgi:hypothetical protein
MCFGAAVAAVMAPLMFRYRVRLHDEAVADQVLGSLLSLIEDQERPLVASPSAYSLFQKDCSHLRWRIAVERLDGVFATPQLIAELRLPLGEDYPVNQVRRELSQHEVPGFVSRGLEAQEDLLLRWIGSTQTSTAVLGQLADLLEQVSLQAAEILGPPPALDAPPPYDDSEDEDDGPLGERASEDDGAPFANWRNLAR